MAGKRNMPPAYKRKAAAYGQGFTVFIKSTVEYRKPYFGQRLFCIPWPCFGHFENSGRTGNHFEKKQVHELGANVEKILYANNPVEIRKIKLWSAAILNIAAMLAAILIKKIYEPGANVEKILYANNPVEIRKIKL